jgi:hypothetical protein
LQLPEGIVKYRFLAFVFSLSFANSALAEYVSIVGPNLLKWTVYSANIQPPAVAYNRLHHFGVWVTDLTGKSCQNTRNQVLSRDSVKDVEFADKRQCYVSQGVWEDPYSNQLFTDSFSLQVDHMVPLKNAYDMGAWTWGENRRCLFANYMGNNFHLKAVSALENMIKQSSAPDTYLPPNVRYVCEYLKDWLQIKLIWKLKMTSRESNAILNQIHDYHCDKDSFKVSQKFITEQRALILKLQPRCVIN